MTDTSKFLSRTDISFMPYIGYTKEVAHMSLTLKNMR